MEKGYTYSELAEDMQRLNTSYSFLYTASLGRSLVGRDIPLIRIGNGKKNILFVGSHHALESITSILLMKYAGEYCRMIANREKILGVDADVIFNERSVYIVPMLNPDGIELHVKGNDELNPLTDRLNEMSGGDYSLWQANGRGVDLNHNYNAGFSEYKKLEPALGIFHGSPTRFSGDHPESEPETACLCSLLRSVDFGVLFALHTQGEEIYADYNGYIPKNGRFIAQKLSSLTGYKLSIPEEAASYGGLKDYFILEFDRPGFTLECGLGKNPLPLCDADKIYARIRKALLQSVFFI